MTRNVIVTIWVKGVGTLNVLQFLFVNKLDLGSKLMFI